MKATHEEIEESKKRPIRVRHANEYNSTSFTNCCGVAVFKEEQCPSCGRYVIGWDWDCEKRSNMRFEVAHKGWW